MLAAAAAVFSVVGVSTAMSTPPAPTPSSPPTGEHLFGQVAIEPAINDQTGLYTYLLTPIKAPLPTKANVDHATAPLYMVIYPKDSVSGVTLNCMDYGLPGNCPDHDSLAAGLVTGQHPMGIPDGGEPSVYGNDPTKVVGHDHLVAVPASGGDFNIAWMVVAVMFTPAAIDHFGSAANLPHLTKETQVERMLYDGFVREVNLFPFTCAVVPSRLYTRGA